MQEQIQQTPSSLKKLIFSIAFFSLVGFADAAYLTIEHFRNAVPACSLVSGCEQVLTSSYAVWYGIPTASLGAIYYLVLFLVTLWFFDSRSHRAFQVVTLLPIAGFAVSLGLVYVQIFIIEAICLYCMLSAFVSTIVFILALLLRSKKNILFHH